MSEPVDIRRIGPLSPLETQMRRVETRAAFLVLELERLEVLDAESPMTRTEMHRLSERIGAVASIAERIARAHGLLP